MREALRELVQAWLIKARHDLEAANRLKEDPDSLLDAAIYHCQQSGEKAVKGSLVYHDIPSTLPSFYPSIRFSRPAFCFDRQHRLESRCWS
jgi:HEPN domain-containing protein